MSAKLGAMRAVVDIGSNSVKFLAGEILCGAPKIHSTSSKVTRLAEKMSGESKILVPAALERTRTALQDFNRQLQGIPREVVATAAARKAQNSYELEAIVKETLGVPMRILSGDEEAEISRRGASIAGRATFPQQKNFLFIDMGGASTEISFSDLQGPKHSFACGAVTFLEGLGLAEIPASDETWEKAHAGIGNFFTSPDLKKLQNFAQKQENYQMVAVGGTLVIAAKIVAEKSSAFGGYGVPISQDKLSLLNEKIRKLGREERFHLDGMEPGREDIICGGLLALDFLMKSFHTEDLFITGWGLRHGLLFGDLLKD